MEMKRVTITRAFDYISTILSLFFIDLLSTNFRVSNFFFNCFDEKLHFDPIARAGVEPGEDVVKLAKKVQALPNVNFKGIQCYNG